MSPEQTGNALVRRCLWDVANGVQVALLVDPSDQSVRAFGPDRPTNAWRSADQVDVGEIIPEFELTVGQLFASLHLD